jgi:hypothetical protein
MCREGSVSSKNNVLALQIAYAFALLPPLQASIAWFIMAPIE